ncbi:AP-1-like transcription factor YAP7 [Nakaseomyces glabratus]|uniref:AP-1-like transcription factor YAP7 n=1 Tax=Candida glabrata TaxID=5478 RepID=A0A0W0DKR3_CANGB|nr:Basic-leucine zipper (bZIP) domain signature [Nakaseomyces glabratus]KAJ9572150.1 hypothetical protein LTX96_0001128 [Nakaseomyces glabratus]KTA97017.1 AP-1-like transcription factor YAP7 [Nakaseomyces glabratus]KTB07015.1 AP-1-like transcription factor YAP7 [Nakaseomyces glabratus]KTB10943.1 AP-1-like transcription factor YAP7 [Nakaseomyces glabratus]
MSDRNWYYQTPYDDSARMYQVVQAPYYVYPRVIYDSQGSPSGASPNGANVPGTSVSSVSGAVPNVSGALSGVSNANGASSGVRTQSTGDYLYSYSNVPNYINSRPMLLSKDQRGSTGSIASLPHAVGSASEGTMHSVTSTGTSMSGPTTNVSMNGNAATSTMSDDMGSKKVSKLKFKSSVMKDGDVEKNEYTLDMSDTAARRRRQNREAQRAYRERKATRINELEKTVSLLQDTIKEYELQMNTIHMRLQTLQEKNDILEKINQELITNKGSQSIPQEQLQQLQQQMQAQSTQGNPPPSTHIQHVGYQHVVQADQPNRNLMESINEFKPMTAVTLKREDQINKITEDNESQKRSADKAFLQLNPKFQKQLSTPVSPDVNSLLLANNETVNVEENEIDMNYMAKKAKTVKEGKCSGSSDCCSKKKQEAGVDPKNSNWKPGSCGTCSSDPYSKAFCQSMFAERRKLNQGREPNLTPDEVQKLRSDMMNAASETPTDQNIYAGTPAEDNVKANGERQSANASNVNDNAAGRGNAVTPISPPSVADTASATTKERKQSIEKLEVTSERDVSNWENRSNSDGSTTSAQDQPTRSTFDRIKKHMEYKRNFPTNSGNSPSNLDNILAKPV